MVGQTVVSPAAHNSGVKQTVCPDMRPLTHSLSVIWGICSGTKPFDCFFGTGQIVQLNASHSVAHFFDTGYGEAGHQSCHLLSGHESAEVAARAIKPSSVSFQAIAPAKVF